MRRSRHLLRPVLAIAVVAAAVFSSPTDSFAAAAAGRGTANVTHVANRPYELRHGSTTSFGTDLEFVKVAGVEYALAGTYINGLQIVDVTDPAQPRIAAVYDCAVLQGDVQVFAQGDRVLATYTADAPVRAGSRCVDETGAAGRLGTFLIDLTQPTDPRSVSFIPIERGSHNMTVHPGGRYLYNSNSEGRTSSTQPHIEIIDISTPETPRRLPDFPIPYGADPDGFGSEAHDVTFSADGSRGYVAASDQTLILDTTDPTQPAMVGRIVDPSIHFVHQADPVALTRGDGTTRELLIVTDEQDGGAPNGNCPGGGLHVYDITGANEADPRKLGTWFIDDRRAQGQGACTSHVLRIYPEQGLATIAWYLDGVRVLDISGLAEVEGSPDAQAYGDGIGLRELGWYAFDNSDTWSFKTNRISSDGSFFGYGNDINRGLDVYRFEGEGDVPPLEPVDLRPAGEPPGPTPEPTPDPSPSPEPQSVSRRSGEDRVTTAAAISSDFLAGVEVVFVATGDDFPDALAAGPAAGKAGGPILLTARDSVPRATLSELERLEPERVVVLGGERAIARSTAERIAEAAGVEYERLAGADRFQTAAALASSFFPDPVTTVFVASGGAFPDALAGGAAAAAEGAPLLLVSSDETPGPTETELRRLDPDRIVLLGGPAAISAAVARDLESSGATVERREGPERYATAADIAAESFPDAATVLVASGERFPDALAGVPLAGALQAPILLVQRDAIPASIAAELSRLSPDQIVVLGGPAAVSVDVEAELDQYVGRQRAARRQRAGDGPLPYCLLLAQA